MTAVARSSTKLWSIQYIRAFAVMGVVVFHQFQSYWWVFKQGAKGVDLFFVISGFIMVAMTDGRAITPVRFVLDRIARIVPLYWLATGILFVAAAAGMKFYRSSADPVLLAKSLFFIPAARSDGEVLPTLPFGWTLNYEMFFYALFAVVLLARERFRALLLCAVFGGLTIAWMALQPKDVVFSTLSAPLILEFLAGVLLGKVFGGDLRRSSLARAIGFTLLIAATSAALALRLPYIDVLWLAVLVVGGGLLVERLGAMPKIPLLLLIGDASFAIYLFQGIAFHLTEMAMWRIEAVIPAAGGHATVVHLLNLAAALALGCGVYRWVERPLSAAARALLVRLTHSPARLSPAV